MRTHELGPHQTPTPPTPSPWTFPGSGLCESSLDRHSPSKLTQDLTARIPKQLLSAVQPASSRRGRAFCSHSLASCASTLPPAKRTGSSSQPPHTYPACTPPGGAFLCKGPQPGGGTHLLHLGQLSPSMLILPQVLLIPHQDDRHIGAEVLHFWGPLLRNVFCIDMSQQWTIDKPKFVPPLRLEGSP